MRGRWTCVAVLVGLLIAAGTAPARSKRKPRHHAPPAGHVLVYSQEWSLWSSRGSLPAGGVEVQLTNRGQDAHDLRIAPLGAHGRLGHVVGGVATTRSGRLGSAVWHIKHGVYELYCSLPGHRALGMQARLVVR